MRCLCCNRAMTVAEANRKYANHEDIQNPEDKYIGLCNVCFSGSELDETELEAPAITTEGEEYE